jgi:glutathione peroxidase
MLRLLAVLLIAVLAAAANAQDKDTATMSGLASIPYSRADGTTETLAQYAGKALVIVNTASRCGFTPQYAGLEHLYQTYRDQGLVVIAFPSNDYGGQEPGSNEEIQSFCRERYNVTFPVMAKMSTKGSTISPLYGALTGPSSPFPGDVKWNFEKFVIDRSGRIVARFRSGTNPESPEMKEAVEKALKG